MARDGKNVSVSCPACGKNSKKKKFSINIESWNCHCWVCGIKGRNPYLIIKKHINESIAQEFSSKFNIKTSDKKNQNTVSVQEKISIPETFIPLCTNLKNRDPDVKACISYLFKRGVTVEDFWYYKIGTCKKGRHRRRVIIPSFDFDGDLNYFVSRAIDSEKSLKYINSKAKKTKIIFNEININWKKPLTILEGPFDLLKSNQNSTCLLGSSLHISSYLFKKIIANKTDVVLCLDGDMRKKSGAIANRLLEYNCNVRMVNLPKEKDAGDMTKQDLLKLVNNGHTWTRQSSMREKIWAIQSGSLL